MKLHPGIKEKYLYTKKDNDMSRRTRNRKQRNLLYNYTFLEWPVDKRLSTFEGISIEFSLAIHKFGMSATDETFQELCTSLAELKTMIEVHEESINGLKANSEAIMQEKLFTLDRRKQEEIKKKRESKRGAKLEDKPQDHEKELQAAEKRLQDKKKKKPFLQKLLSWSWD